jgi:hypothetical protein
MFSGGSSLSLHGEEDEMLAEEPVVILEEEVEVVEDVVEEKEVDDENNDPKKRSSIRKKSVVEYDEGSEGSEVQYGLNSKKRVRNSLTLNPRKHSRRS